MDRTKPPQTPADSRVTSCRRCSRPSCRTAWAWCWWKTRAFPLVTARLTFQAGSKFDPKDMPGLAEAVASLLTEGTKTRTSRADLRRDRCARRLARARPPEPIRSAISGNALSENLPKLLDADGGRRHATPTFPQDEVEPLQAESHPEPAAAALASPASWRRRRWRKWSTDRRPTRTSRRPRLASRSSMPRRWRTIATPTWCRTTPALLMIGKLPAREPLMKMIDGAVRLLEAEAAARGAEDGHARAQAADRAGGPSRLGAGRYSRRTAGAYPARRRTSSR